MYWLEARNPVKSDGELKVSPLLVGVMSPWRQESGAVVVRVPTKCCVCTGWARNPVKPGGDGRGDDLGHWLLGPWRQGLIDPGGSSPSELCTGYITLKCSCNYECDCD